MSTKIKRKKILRILAWSVAAIVLLPIGLVTAAGGWLTWRGQLSIGTVGVEDGERPIFEAAKARKAAGNKPSRSRNARRRRGVKIVNPWLAEPSTDIQRLCRSSVSTAEEIRDVLRQLQVAGAPGIEPLGEERISVIVLPRIIRPLFEYPGGGMGGAMAVFGGRGVLLANGGPEISGRTIYHEAVHFSQFVRSEERQRLKVDSLLRLDAVQPFSAEVVWDGWESVGILAGWSNHPELVKSVGDSILAQIAKGGRASDLSITLQTLNRVLVLPENETLRRRLGVISRIRRGMAGVEGELRWSEELTRLMVFETEASALSTWCHGNRATILKLPPVIVKAPIHSDSSFWWPTALKSKLRESGLEFGGKQR